MTIKIHISLEDSDRCFVMDGDLDLFSEALRKLRILKLTHNLTARESAVLEERYGENQTFEEIGKRYGVSRERIRQIEQGALRKIASSVRAVMRRQEK